MTINLLITDDHDLVHAGLVEYLGTAPDIEVVGEMAEQIAFFPGPVEQNPVELILSDRERQIFHLIVDGINIKEIAAELAISDKTVSTHKLNKLGLKSAVDLVRYAIQEKR